MDSSQIFDGLMNLLLPSPQNRYGHVCTHVTGEEVGQLSIYQVSARFGSTYTKTGIMQRRLAWPLLKNYMQIHEAVHIFFFVCAIKPPLDEMGEHSFFNFEIVFGIYCCCVLRTWPK